MDEVYRGYRVVIRLIEGQWVARVTEPGGKAAPITVRVAEQQGESACADLARSRVEKYLAYIGELPPGNDESGIR